MITCSMRETNETLCKKVMEDGGWPREAMSLVMKHSCERDRPCYFSKIIVRDEWNTSVLTRDEYYWWALSDTKKAEIEREIRNKIRRLI